MRLNPMHSRKASAAMAAGTTPRMNAKTTRTTAGRIRYISIFASTMFDWIEIGGPEVQKDAGNLHL